MSRSGRSNQPGRPARSRWRALICAWLIAGTAHAETLPGRALVIGTCGEDPDAACWTEARPLDRFRAPYGVFEAPRDPDIRLAWVEGDLLVRARGLRPEESVEISLFDDEAGLLKDAWTTSVPEGLHRLHPVLPLTAGIIRAASVLLLSTRAEDGSLQPLPWTPSGPAELQRSFPLLAVDKLPTTPAIEVRAEAGEIEVDAPGATIVHLQEWEMVEEVRFRGTTPAWSMEAASPARGPRPPETGWYDLLATWQAESGEITDLSARRLWLEAPTPPALIDLGIHPAPRWRQVQPGAAFRLGKQPNVVAPAEWQAIAAQVAAELSRFLDRPVGVGTGPPSKGDVALVDLGKSGADWLAALPTEGKTLASQPEGFLLHAGPDGLRVGANLPRGALYGGFALVDLLVGGPGRGTIELADAPDLPLRILHHVVNFQQPVHFTPEDYIGFLQRAVARGRYNTLSLDVSTAMVWPGHPELTPDAAFSDEEIQRILATARALGIEVAPAFDLPGHATWLTRRHPELAEGSLLGLLCTRHPGTRPLVTELVDHLLELVGPGSYFHIGHDEVIRKTQRLLAEERCPRCAGTPPAALLGEEVGWFIDMLEARGRRPLAWADIFTPGFNGYREGASGALDHLSPHQRERLILMTWKRLGDGERLLTDAGFDVIRAHTGFKDDSRGGLSKQLDQVKGEGLAIFLLAPWSALNIPVGRRAIDYHWPSVILAGAAAWNATLDDSRIQAMLARLSGATAYRPGRTAWIGWKGKSRPLAPEGAALGAEVPETVWPDAAEVAEISFARMDPRIARAASPVRLPIHQKVRGISILQAALVSWEAEGELRAALRSTQTIEGQPLGILRVRWADGQTAERSLHLGLDTGAFEVADRAIALWRTGGTLTLQSPDLAALDPRGADRRLFRLDWVNPRPNVAVESAELEVSIPGVGLVVGGASALW